MEEFDLLVETISEFLGKPKKIYENHSQVSFNCPLCDEDRNKGNLEVNIEKSVFHCWSCGDVNDMHGPLGKLFDKFGTKKQKKIFKLFQPDEIKQKENTPKNNLKLPEGYTLFKDSSLYYPVRNQAYNYLKSRGITDEIIEKFKIGFCDKGSFTGRIIIPSYDRNGKLNYFIARSWSKHTKSKYKNPVAAKDEIIFNEYLIDWDKDVFLCEGVFDAIFLENSVAMLGKHLSELLLNTIYEKAKGDIVICLDSDAWDDAVKIYNTLNGGRLYGKIKIIKLTDDKDVADLLGKIDDYYIEMK